MGEPGRVRALTGLAVVVASSLTAANAFAGPMSTLASRNGSSCWLTVAGDMWCWGRNDAGQHDDGSRNARPADFLERGARRARPRSGIDRGAPRRAGGRWPGHRGRAADPLLGVVGLGFFWRQRWFAAGLIAAALLPGLGCGRTAAAPSRARADEAFRAYRDPNTGRLGEPPAGTVTVGPASAAPAAAPLAEEAAPGGGRMIRLKGAFHSQFVAGLDDHGVHASCAGTDAARTR